MVDRILDFDSRERIVGIKNVSVSDGCFMGGSVRFLPNSLVIESLCQTAATLILKDSEFSTRHASLHTVTKAVFHKDVSPGDQLRLDVVIKKIKKNTLICEGSAYVEGKVVCDAHFEFLLSHEPSKPQIHSTAYVHHTASLGKNVVIGPNSIIGEHVVIGDNTQIEASCLVDKWTRIGDDCHLHFGSVIGSPPQDMGYKGEKSWVVLGDRNEIREYVTINRSTGEGTSTSIGDDNLLLTHVHLAHNCQLGSHITIANGTNIAGHTTVEDRAVIGGMTGIHQFCRIGRGAMVGAYTRLPQDVPPFMMCEGNPALIRGVNVIGLRRNGATKSALEEVKAIHKLVFRSDKNTTQSLKEIKALCFKSAEAKYVIDFLKADSKRGFTKKSDTSTEP